MINKIVIEIDGKNYTIPKVITVTHYSEMMMKMSFSETATEKAYDVIGTLLNIPYKILRELNPDSLADLSIYLQNKVVECDIPYEHTFKFNNFVRLRVAIPRLQKIKIAIFPIDF